jgi:5'-deoxynucleotidase YfbR-like HD superfamily hydrolase
MSIIQEALYHDIPEVITGDIPATAKWDFPRLNGAIEAAEAEIIKAFDNPTGADQMDRDIVRFADLLQLTVKAHEEVECGNIKMFDIRHNGIEACLKLLHEKLPNFTNAHNLFELLLKDWQNESD